MYEPIENYYLSFPSSALILGPSFSGKTTLIKNILANWSTCICPSRPKLKRVLIFYNTWQKLYREISHESLPADCEIFFFQQPPTLEQLSSSLGTLADDESQVVFIDDMGSKVGLKDNCIEELFTVFAHHVAGGSGTMCFLTVQDLQQGGDSMRCIRKNSTYIFLMPAVLNGNTLDTLQRSLFYRCPGFLPTVADHVFLTRQMDYIMIDNSPASIRSNKHRLRCGFFPWEKEKLVYNYRK